MAKKRKKEKEKEEEYEFIPPEFDEKEFILKGMRDSKAVVVTVIYAILLGVVAGVISVLNRQLVGLAFLVVIVGIFTLKPVYEFAKIETKGFQKRNWAGNIGTFFFTFLAVWILLMNTPFADFTNPVVGSVIVWVDNGTSVGGLEYMYADDNNTYWWQQVNASIPAVIHAGTDQTINITAKVADNGRLRTVEISVVSTANFVNMTRSSVDDRYEHVMSAVGIESSFTFFIRANDAAGNSILFQTQAPVPVSS